MQTFLDDGNQYVGAHRNPDLRFHRVFARAQEGLDAQVLFDPLEEQFHLPALAVQIGNEFGLQSKVVGQKRDAFAGFVLDHHAAQRLRVILARMKQRQHAGLIAHNRCGAALHGTGVTPPEFGIALGAGHKEALRLVNRKESAEIQITPIQQVKRTRFYHQLVEHIDLVGLAVGDVNEARDRAVKIEQRMQPNGRLGGAKRCPRIQRQTQIDGGRIEGIHGSVQVDAQRLFGVQRTRDGNQVLGKVGVDLPRPGCVRIGQGIARNRLAAKAHVIQPLGLRTQVDFDVAQRLPVGELRKRHGEELIQTREVLDLVIALMGGHTAAKRAQRQVGHELRKHELALVHGGPSRQNAKDQQSDARRSNRDQTKTPNSSSDSLTYDVLM